MQCGPQASLANGAAPNLGHVYNEIIYFHSAYLDSSHVLAKGQGKYPGVVSVAIRWGKGAGSKRGGSGISPTDSRQKNEKHHYTPCPLAAFAWH